MTGRRFVTVTSAAPDGIVIEVQVSCPADCAPDALRSQLYATTQHALTAYETGAPVDVEVDDAWLSARVAP